jgi:collagen type VI alpha
MGQPSELNTKNHCSTCLDSGIVRCTVVACNDDCFLPPDPGHCKASINAFYYDRPSISCRRFTYGGCGGNANKFRSVKDCLMRCRLESEFDITYSETCPRGHLYSETRSKGAISYISAFIKRPPPLKCGRLKPHASHLCKLCVGKQQT